LETLLKEKVQDTAKIKAKISELKKSVDKFYKDFSLTTDMKITEAMLSMYFKNIMKEQQPDYFIKMVAKYKNDFTKLTAFLFSKSIFKSKETVNSFLDKPSLKTLESDQLLKLMNAFTESYNNLGKSWNEANNKLTAAKRLFIAGLRELNPEAKYYPDANQTMRLTYGKVMDYYPADAVHYKYYTTLEGVMQKEDSSNWEFVVPAKLKTLYKAKDFGEYGENGIMKTDFITNNDITGGNSGSPVLDGSGNLVGLAFDGNWEAMSGNICFEPELQRTINVDIRYVLFIIDKYAGAKNLIAELNIVR
jgi:hypothetical protein